MYPKKSIQQLNLRREYRRRLEFVKRRIPETMVERHFICGTIATLPEEMRTPPDWAQRAAKLAWEFGLGAAFKHINKEGIEKDPRGAVREMIAILESLTAYMNHLGPDAKELDSIDPEFAEIRRAMSKLVATKLIKHLRKLDSRLDTLLPPPSRAQLLDYAMRTVRATEAIEADEDGILARTQTGKIYYIVWFFWPELETKPTLTAKVLHRWLGETLGVFTSDKLVERIYSQLGMAGRARSSST